MFNKDFLMLMISHFIFILKEHDILLEENSNLAKSNMDLTEKLEQLKHDTEQQINELQNKFKASEAERIRAEQVNYSHLMTSGDIELEHKERLDEIDQLKKDFLEVQECLRLTSIERNNLLVWKIINLIQLQFRILTLNPKDNRFFKFMFPGMMPSPILGYVDTSENCTLV